MDPRADLHRITRTDDAIACSCGRFVASMGPERHPMGRAVDHLAAYDHDRTVLWVLGYRSHVLGVQREWDPARAFLQARRDALLSDGGYDVADVTPVRVCDLLGVGELTDLTDPRELEFAVEDALLSRPDLWTPPAAAARP